MNKFYFLAFLFLTATLSVKVFSQTASFNFTRLSKQDTLLSGWKFHPGDDSKWKNPDFNDAAWSDIDPGLDILDFEALQKSGTGWIRLHIRVSSAVADQPLSAWVEQYTASEIYLNGKLIKKYGHISNDPAKISAGFQRELFSVKLQPGTDNVLAVRLAYQSCIPYLSPNFITLPAFTMHMNTDKAAFSNYQDYLSSNKKISLMFTIIIGMFLFMSIINLIGFIFEGYKKANIYYTCFSVFFGASLSIALALFDNYENMAAQMWGVFFIGLGFVITYLFLVLTVYALFGYRRRLVFSLLTVAGAFVVISQFFTEITGYFACSNIFPVLCLLEGIHICIWAIKQKKKDALLILGGIVLCILFNILTVVSDQTSAITYFLFGSSFLSFPIGMFFYLSFQSAQTNKKLKITLKEVQLLSEQNLAREQEKQHILANQNELLEIQVSQRTDELNRSLHELKAAQNQVIQSEKMASLGELTAGIAHEIQNPLNFVNNFSDVSVELLQELKEELGKGDLEEVAAIAEDVAQNLEKIAHHGRRADGIVKGMLQHSRTSPRQKEPTDINTLADEYLRLSYHGLLTKDKSFNAELVTNFKPGLPLVNVIPQDIGRVLLNLFTNAFYATQQKQLQVNDGSYKPTITVTTNQIGNTIEIEVRDNGTGIPDAIKDKILQPFFTTKPTGEGTGLGLSLSYDIVVKGHGGQLNVESIVGEVSQFSIYLPL